MNGTEEEDQIPLFGFPAENIKTCKTVPQVKAEAAKNKAAKSLVKSAERRPPREMVAKKVPAASGQVPAGDVRLTANIRDDLHLRLKIAAARQRTTIGELIEKLVEKHLPSV